MTLACRLHRKMRRALSRRALGAPGRGTSPAATFRRARLGKSSPSATMQSAISPLAAILASSMYLYSVASIGS